MKWAIRNSANGRLSAFADTREEAWIIYGASDALSQMRSNQLGIVAVRLKNVEVAAYLAKSKAA